MERYNGWLIDIEDVTNFWLSDGMVKLKAVITPDVELVYNFLKEKGYVSTDSDNLAIYISNIRNINRVIPYPQRDVEIFLALLDYAGTHKHTTTQVGHALFSISSTGKTNTRNRAIQKIIRWIDNTLSNPINDIISMLMERHLLS